jgi:hypothetical protein
MNVFVVVVLCPDTVGEWYEYIELELKPSLDLGVYRIRSYPISSRIIVHYCPVLLLKRRAADVE